MMLAALLCKRVKPHRVIQVALSVERWTHSYTLSHVPVVIAGAGPTGLVLSCLLSQYGVRHMVLERSEQLTQHPQAHYINNRTMEVFRGIPGLSSDVSAANPPLEQWRKFIYCESMAVGQILGEVDHFPGQTVPHDPQVSPEPVTHLSQHRLLPLLLKQAQQLSTAHGNCADIQFGKTVTAVSNVEFPHHLQSHSLHNAQQVQAPTRQQAAAHSNTMQRKQQKQQGLSADAVAQEYPVCIAVESCTGGGTQLVRCSYLAAADGANSGIRQLLGIPMRGDPALQHLMSIHFTWQQLGQALLSRGRGGMLYFVFNRQVVAVVVAHDLSRGEFVAQVPYYPPLQSPADFTAEVCKQLIAAAAGWPLGQLQQDQATSQRGDGSSSSSSSGFELHSVKNWVMSALVAEEYTAWNNRVLLVGDSAHRFPPAGGFGMNTGIQDAHNLAWKLAAVLSGTADPVLLNSYQLERQPVATANTNLSISNWQEAIRVPQALGLDPKAATLVNQLVSSAPLPMEVGRWVLESVLAAGRGLAAAVTPIRKGALQQILQSGQSLRLQFPKEDLGFVYQQGAVAAEMQPSDSSRVSSSSSGRGNVYIPSTAVGARLPHCWIQLLGEQGSPQQVSTLDLVTPKMLGLNMLLICSSHNTNSSDIANSKGSYPDIPATSIDWLSAGQQLQQQGWPIKILQLLPQGTSSSGNTNTAIGTSNSRNIGSILRDAGHASTPGGQYSPSQQQQQQQSGVIQAVDVEGSWAALHSGCSTVALLVRPDGHIAWKHEHRQMPGASGSRQAAMDELRQVMTEVLCLQLPVQE